jgi:hypothetical protein
MAIWATKHAAALLGCAKNKTQKFMCTRASNGHLAADENVKQTPNGHQAQMAI